MMAGTGDLLGGLLVLACHMQDVDPTLGSPIGDMHPLSFIARDGKGAMVGWAGLKGQSDVTARRQADGTISLTGTTFAEDGAETWATLRRAGEEFEMEWLMHDHLAKDGRATVALWSKGRCEQLGTGKEALQ